MMQPSVINKRVKHTTKSRSINDLSNDVLIHILSFLPIKYAFRTTILSKRWFLLFYSLAVISISDNEAYTKKAWVHFCRFVDTVLLSTHAEEQTLKTFHLDCRSKNWRPNSFICFDTWVEAAKRRGVEDLYLCMLQVMLSPTIFVCETLVVLKLDRLNVPSMSRFSVDLPSLKTLDLCFVCFQNSDDYMKLLSGSPKLEDLKTLYIKLNVRSTAIENFEKPLLSNLIKANFRLFEVPFRAVYNVQFLNVLQMGTRLPSEENTSYYKSLPIFENLIELRLSWTSRVTHDWSEVMKMLQNCPKLQTLSIKKWWGSITTIMENGKYQDHVPECVSSHLTTINITNYQTVEADFKFASYILKNARLLKDMTICFARCSDIMQWTKCIEDLSRQRISGACKISLRY
ncbi:putative FBD-associated F-box protein At5g56440 [Medicago truncatula]|uniref:putative FBD-associated F-box protein At5g56440 n=1 Tax=Medicago truncatula TaxID=3880 RepID=UPI000D2F2B54|nr:putative FBD-associated F-box protein At5g56440 [Medicago truncatula]